MERDPKFSFGDRVRIKAPDDYIATVRNKVRDRDAIVLENIQDLADTGPARRFRGRVYLEFQKRNGRGKTWREVWDERALTLASQLQGEGA